MALTYQAGKGEENKYNENNKVNSTFEYIGLAVGKVYDGSQEGDQQQNQLYRTEHKINLMMGEQRQNNHRRYR